MSALQRRSGSPSARAAASVVALQIAVGTLVGAERPQTRAEALNCSPETRRDVLRAMQAEVLRSVPSELPSFERALGPGGPLAGWRLSHGYVALATAGAVAVDNLEAVPPRPPVLLYEPATTSAPARWLDFDGPDDPYRLAGWAYIAPYTPGSRPPNRRCISAEEWVVHEAGWHLKDGGMRLTEGATTEPSRPPNLAIHMWHPRVWDLHVWRGDSGVPVVTFANPNERRGGKELPRGAFFSVVDGKKSDLTP